MLNSTLIFVDTETGGLNPHTHSLLSVAFIVVKDGRKVAEKEWKVKYDTYSVTAEALMKNGINLVEHEKEAKDKRTVAEEIIHFLGQYCSSSSKGVLVGQNPKFDQGFIESFMGDVMVHSFMEGREEPFLTDFKGLVSHRTIDLVSITAFLNMLGVIDTEDLGLSAVIKALNLKTEGRHTALGDAEVTHGALLAMKEIAGKRLAI